MSVSVRFLCYFILFLRSYMVYFLACIVINQYVSAGKVNKIIKNMTFHDIFLTIINHFRYKRKTSPTS